MIKHFAFAFLFILGSFLNSQAQESEDQYDWDNIMYVGNKVSWGSNKFKNSAELQFDCRITPGSSNSIL